jgi:transcriptional regulator with XRE-family HTH domain/Tfp pilus assembly protein PilF
MRQRTDADAEWGLALAILRIVRGWTQLRLGSTVAVAKSTLSDYESGARSAPLPVLRQMVAAMGYPAHRLDRARALVRWSRAARQLQRRPPVDPAAACVEVTAGAAGMAREEAVRIALRGMLDLAPEDHEEAPAKEDQEVATPTLGAASAPCPRPLARSRTGGRRPQRAGGPAAPLAQALRVLRLIAGLERQQLGEAVGLTTAAIQSYERGKRDPSPAGLTRLLDAMDLPVEVFDRTLRFLAAARASRRWYAREGAGSPRARIEDLAAAEACREEDGARAWLGRLQRAGLFLAARRRAPGLWRRLQAHPPATWRALVPEAVEFRDVGLSELLCDESIRAAADSARRAVRLAKLAVLVALGVPGTEGWRQRIAGYAWAHLANALRVAGRFLAAAEAFRRAEELWQAGAGEDPGLLNEARVLGLQASFLRDRGESAAALALLDRALAVDRWGETSSLLLNKARAFEVLGDIAGSIAILRQVVPQIDEEREPRKLWVARYNLALNLSQLGQHADAALVLPEVQALARRLGHQLDGLRVVWLQAKVAAGLGRTAEAVAKFERLRTGFAHQGIAYDAALATLELAELHATLGHTGDVKVLAQRSASIFHHQGVHREARRALDLFGRAAEEERASLALIRTVLSYLQRARRNRQLRFQEPR